MMDNSSRPCCAHAVIMSRNKHAYEIISPKIPDQKLCVIFLYKRMWDGNTVIFDASFGLKQKADAAKQESNNKYT